MTYNPLDKHNLGKSVVDALLKKAAEPLGDVATFTGAGVYAIYYRGDFPAYQKLAKLNQKAASYPIYVGKAVPKGGRKGASLDASQDSDALSKRLQEHAASITATKTLKLDDFLCRYLVVDDIWISLGEALLIQKHQPLWNQVVEGFGNHDPGGGRYEGKRPLWDELHPGRAWAARCQPPKLSTAELLALIADYMKSLG
jgi:hypothetical protein